MLSLLREEEQPPPEARSATVGAPAGTAALRIPQFRTTGSVVAATNKRSYANAHAYHVNSLSVNPDGETFISADDLRINLWNLEVNNQSFSTWPLVLLPFGLVVLVSTCLSVCLHIVSGAEPWKHGNGMDMRARSPPD
jgi:WD40 repeat protein